MKEEAEAAKEIAIVTGKAIDASVKLGGFFRLIFGDVAIEFGGAVKEWATYVRYLVYVGVQFIEPDGLDKSSPYNFEI
jgi:hypothetical protein